MTEIGIEKLKLLKWEPLTDPDAHFNAAYLFDHLPAIIAALEDRDRLRAALDSITHVVPVEHGIHTHVSVWVNHAKAGTLVLRTEEYEVFRAALERRDG